MKSAVFPKTFKLYACFICMMAALFYCYEYFLRIQPSVINAELMQSFHITAGGFGVLTAFYYYAYTPMQLPVGILMDRFQPKKVLFFACLICAFGTYLFGMTTQFWIAAVGRFLIGFGSAFAFVGVLKVATIWLPEKYFPLVAGLTTSLGTLGAMFGNIAMVTWVQQLGWQTTLMYSAHVGVVFAILLFLLIPHHEMETTAQNNSFQWRDVWAVFMNHQIWLAGTIGAILYMSLSVIAEVWGPSFLQSVRHFSKQDAVLAMSMIFFGWAIGGPLLGYFSGITRKRSIFLVVGSLLGAALFSAVLFHPTMSLKSVMGLCFFFGVVCSSEILVFAVARDNAPEHLAGTVLAVTNMLVMLGGALFQPIVGYLLDYHWLGELDNGLRVFTSLEFHRALLFLPISLLVCAVLGYFIRD